MNSMTKEFIEENIELIERKDFETLYAEDTNVDFRDLTETLLSCDINPLLYMTSVPKGYMEESNTIEELVVPDNITVIGQNAFRSCPKLKKVTLPETIEIINPNVFIDSPIESINLPKSLVAIGAFTFSATHLKNIIIPNKIGIIPQHSFYDCLYLESVTLGRSVKMIGDRAFAYCCNLHSVNLNDGLEHIGAGAFRHCDSLKDIYIPESVKDIAYSAFRHTSATILCKKNSFAEEFAYDYGNPYKII